MGQSFFFKGLNELRAIAAFSVIFHHLELYCFRDGKASLFHIDCLRYFINSIGKNGVYLFFVLSGFLITFLLLGEKEQHAKVNIKNFYLRRVFRIWPLYAIIIFLSLVAVPWLVLQTDFFDSETYYMSLIRDQKSYDTKNTLYYIFFLSNFALPIVGAAQTWSVSVEEQFYLVWPQLFRFSIKKIWIAFVAVFTIFVLIKAFGLPSYEYIKRIPLEIMATGGLFAYFWRYHKSRFERYFQSNGLFALHLLLVGLSIFFPVPRLIVAFLFGILILFVISERKWNLRSKTLSLLGVISYGIYMYHPLLMFVSSAIANKFSQNVMVYKLLLYLLTVAATISVSYLSYHFIEKKLIIIKDKKFSSLK